MWYYGLAPHLHHIPLFLTVLQTIFCEYCIKPVKNNVNEIIIEDNDSPYHMVMAKFAVLITGNKI